MRRDDETLKPEHSGIAQQMFRADTPTFWHLFCSTSRAAIAERANPNGIVTGILRAKSAPKEHAKNAVVKRVRKRKRRAA